MEAKAPVLLVVLIDVPRLRWLAAGIGLESGGSPGGEVLPLVASADGDLEPCLSAGLDERVSFLRHRLSGVLQRGCDRLWARQKKACQIIFVASQKLDESAGPLTQGVADHFVEWLSNPPVAFFVGNGQPAEAASRLTKVAGELSPAHEELLKSRFPKLMDAAVDPNRWELIQKKPYSKSAT